MRYWKAPPVPAHFRVGVVVATYDHGPKLACLLQSLEAQTFPHWRAVVVHDGPWREDTPGASARVRFAHTPSRENHFGHNCREYGRVLLQDPTRLDDRPTHVLFTNGDNYYAPVFFHELLGALYRDRADLAYCNCVHSHPRNGKLWQPMKAELKRGKVDLGGWLCRSDWVFATPFDGRAFAADWDYLSRLLERRPKAAKADGYLFTHN